MTEDNAAEFTDRKLEYVLKLILIVVYLVRTC